MKDYIYTDGGSLLEDYFTGVLKMRIKYRREELSIRRYDPSVLGVRVQTTRRSDGLENQAIKNMDDPGIHYLNLQLNIVEAFLTHLKQTDDSTYSILYSRYKSDLTYNEIGQRVGLTGGACRKKRSDAAKELESWLNM